MSEGISIQEAARQTGLTAHTLRYYEQIGLIPGVVRSASGHRSYAKSDMAWIHFLLCLKATGMGIKDMQAFARLRMQGDPSVPQRRKMLEIHRSQLRDRMRELQLHLDILEDKIHHYTGLEKGAQA